MDFLWVGVAFICGFLAKQMALPPLIGYLAAGFGLHAYGVVPTSLLDNLGDIGVMLLLFTIGLKLDIRSLFKTEVWTGASVHMLVVMVLTIVNSLCLSVLGFMYFSELDLAGAALIGFAVSFSSTVIAIKVLEEKGEMRSRHGQLAIGILVIQDIAAVVFVTFAAGVSLSWWVLLLLGLPLLKPLLALLLDRSGHGELLPLVGIFLAFAGGELFEAVGLKAHLGALVIAVLLSDHSKAVELSKSLLNFKDIFLIGFFLSIGFTALPTIDMLGVALIMAVALPFKAALLFWWLSYLKLRVRTAFLASLSLANYSEFGLIVCAISVSQGLLAKEWLVIMALSVSLSFVFSSIINTYAHGFFQRAAIWLKRFETKERLPADRAAEIGDAEILIIGMGRVGSGAYDTFADGVQENTQHVCGIEMDRSRVKIHCEKGRRVVFGDAEDPEFWAYTPLQNVRLIMFAMPSYLDILEAQKQLNQLGYQGRTSAVAKHKDEEQLLLAGGVNEVFNFYAEVGYGFANQSIHLLDVGD